MHFTMCASLYQEHNSYQLLAPAETCEVNAHFVPRGDQ